MNLIRFFFLHQWAGHDGHFESQIVVSHPPSLVYVQPNDPRMLCDHFMGAFRTYSSTRFITGELRVHFIMSMTGYG